jgi:hypothetical protein
MMDKKKVMLCSQGRVNLLYSERGKLPTKVMQKRARLKLILPGI